MAKRVCDIFRLTHKRFSPLLLSAQKVVFSLSLNSGYFGLTVNKPLVAAGAFYYNLRVRWSRPFFTKKQKNN